jgi:hypothetical protein
MENMKDIVATQCVETRRVAVRSTVWLDDLVEYTKDFFSSLLVVICSGTSKSGARPV